MLYRSCTTSVAFNILSLELLPFAKIELFSAPYKITTCFLNEFVST